MVIATTVAQNMEAFTRNRVTMESICFRVCSQNPCSNPGPCCGDLPVDPCLLTHRQSHVRAHTESTSPLWLSRARTHFARFLELRLLCNGREWTQGPAVLNLLLTF